MLHIKYYRCKAKNKWKIKQTNKQRFGISLVHITVPFERSTFALGKGCLAASSLFTELIVFMVDFRDEKTV